MRNFRIKKRGQFGLPVFEPQHVTCAHSFLHNGWLLQYPLPILKVIFNLGPTCIKYILYFTLKIYSFPGFSIFSSFMFLKRLSSDYSFYCFICLLPKAILLQRIKLSLSFLSSIVNSFRCSINKKGIPFQSFWIRTYRTIDWRLPNKASSTLHFHLASDRGLHSLWGADAQIILV